MVRWQAAGLSRDESISLLEDEAVGVPPTELSSARPGELVLLIGDLGAGKSICMERVCQRLITEAHVDSSTALPIFLEANRITRPLSEEIRGVLDVCAESACSIFLLIDGLDECGSERAIELLDEIRLVLHLQEGSRALASSREMSVLTNVSERAAVPLLSRQSAIALVNRIANTHFHEWTDHFSESIFDAIQRPLFAILLGVYYKRPHAEAPKSVAALVQYLVDESRRKIRGKADNITDFLVELAIISQDRKGLIPVSDLGRSQDINAACDTGLVVRNGTGVGFGLPIFGEWFASEAIASGRITTEDLLLDPKRLEKWRAPLAIAIATGAQERVAKMLDAMARHSIGYTASLLAASTDRWRWGRTVSLPPAIECGKLVCRAMSSFVSGLGGLATEIAPVDESNNVCQLGVAVQDKALTITWADKACPSNPVVELPSGFKFMEQRDEHHWRLEKWASPADEPTWAWEWARSTISIRLNELCRNKQLPITSYWLAQEKAWIEACRLTGRGARSYISVPLDEVELPIQRHDAQQQRLRETDGPDTYLYLHPSTAAAYSFFREYCPSLRRADISEIRRPFPGPDLQRNRYPWLEYSPSQLLARTKAVYEASIAAYLDMANGCLQPFRDRLNFATILPVDVMIEIHESKNDGVTGGPWMDITTVPLPNGAPNAVNVSYHDPVDNTDRRIDPWTELRRLRPDSYQWLKLRFQSSVMDKVFAPDAVSQFVYAWIEEDLRHIKWID
jgi:hypothetical protein